MRTRFVGMCVILLCMGLGSLALAKDEPKGTPPKEAAPAAEVDGKSLFESKGCAHCHGEDGRRSKGFATPVLAGQKPGYTLLVLHAYKTGERLGLGGNSHREHLDKVSDEEMALIANYLATLK